MPGEPAVLRAFGCLKTSAGGGVGLYHIIYFNSCFAEQSYLFFSLFFFVFYLETTI